MDGLGADGLGADGLGTDGLGTDGLGTGRASVPRPADGMSRTLPVLGNSYGIALGTAG
ncbi:MAG TPA: hypothetical protein VGI05_20710 [Streptosporangiaceae bacterium]|jgi:hypothetical protein